MTAWMLVVLGANLTVLPITTFHPTRGACEQQMAVEVVHLAATNRPPADAFCQAIRVPALRAVTLP